MSELALVPSRSTVRWCDGAVVVAVAVFAALGAAAGVHLAALADVHRTLLQAAEALDVTARAVALIEEVPFVGDDAGRMVESVRATAAEVRTSAAALDERLQALGLIAAIVITAVPLVPLVLLYAPLRLARSRALRTLRRLLAGPPEPALVEHLARQAVHHLPLRQLYRVTPYPWLDLARGHHAPLAAAELRRLGIRAPAWLGPAAGG